MPSCYFSHHWREPGTGAIICPDVEVELDVTITVPADGEIRVDAVRTTNSRGEANADLLASSNTGVRDWAREVKAAAESDSAFIERVMDDAGFVFDGHPGDPESGWRMPRRRVAA